MIDQFHELIYDLGTHLKISLKPDKRGACKLSYHNLFFVQLDYDPSKERILMASFVCDVPPGKLRENVFRDALKTHHPFPEVGVFGYCERTNKLSLFTYIPLPGLTAIKLATLLSAFIEKANKWREAVGTGQTALLVPTMSIHPPPPFNLKP